MNNLFFSQFLILIFQVRISVLYLGIARVEGSQFPVKIEISSLGFEVDSV
jgi:hypothetical protein